MSWSQLIKPNYEINEQAGMCLSYARRAFGLPPIEPTAHEAWKRAKYKHEDRRFPAASVPVWFEWWGDLGSGWIRYDHVAIRDASGKVWSSPLTGNGRASFSTVDELTKAFGGGMKYLGWSEDVSGYRVAEENAIVKNTIDTERILNKSILGRDGLGGRPDAFADKNNEAIKASGVLDRELNQDHIIKLWTSPEAVAKRAADAAAYRERDALRAQVKALQTTVRPSSTATVLEPGLYEVKTQGGI